MCGRVLAGRATSEPVAETAGLYGETAMNPQNFSATFFRNGTTMVIFERIDDPQGEFGEFGVPAPAPAPPVPAPAVLAPAPIVQAGIILARVHRIDEDVHAFVRDVEVGEETLVVNPTLIAEEWTDDEGVLDDAVDDAIGGVEDAEANADVQVGLQDSAPLENPSTSSVSITPAGQLETATASEELHITLETGQLETASEEMQMILDQISRPAPGVDTKFTATMGSFAVATPQLASECGYSTTTPMVVSVHNRLLEPALEAVNRPQMAARVLEKADGEGEEEPVRKRQVVEKDPASTL